MTQVEDAGQDPVGQIVIIGSDADLVRESGALESLTQVGVTVTLASVPGRRPSGQLPRTAPQVHELGMAVPTGPVRRRIDRGIDQFFHGAARARRVARRDPWLQPIVSDADAVVLLDQAGGLATYLTERVGLDKVVIGHSGLEELTATLVARALSRHVVRGGGATRLESAEWTALTGAVRAAQRQWAGAPRLTEEVRLSLRLLLTLTRDPEQTSDLTILLAPLLGSGDAVLTAYRARAELELNAHTDLDPAVVAASLLDEAETQIQGAFSAAVAWTSLSLEVLFHRELHSDSVNSPLLRNPDAYLSPVRASRLWELLTSPTAAGGLQETAERDHSESPLQVLVLPGAYGEFYAALASALRVSSAVQVSVWRRRDLRPHLRTMGTTPTVVERRLRAGLEQPFEGYPELVTALSEPGPDVLVVDWADKTSVLATLLAPSATRIVLRVHGVDLLRPWLHLIDWARVDALICVSKPLAALAREVLGPALENVDVHVVPNLVQLEQTLEFDMADPRHLAMVGWGQRVKDPLWALEVLARLRRDGQDWRLTLFGHDFPDDATASGRRYAQAFRERAMEDDVRDHVRYAGFVTDLTAELSRVGFILSTSLRESWHMGLVEGVAAGAVPVVRDWPMMQPFGGARSIYPTDWVVSSVEEAVSRIQSLVDRDSRAEASASARARLAGIADPVNARTQIRSVVLGRVGELADLSDRGAHDQAVTTVRRILDEPDAPPVLLQQAAISAVLAGEPSLRLECLHRWAAVDPREHVLQLVRQQQGRLRELTPGWHPPIPWPISAYEPVPGRIMHVLKASLPYRRSGYAVRSFYLLREQARAGIDVMAVTPLDFPLGEDSTVPPEDPVGGVRHVRLLRDTIPKPEHPDDYLSAFGAALAGAVESWRPALIHVHSGHRGYELALVALAVAQQAQIPVVYEVRGLFEALWTSDLSRAEDAEIYRRRREVETHCMATADAVTTLSESMRYDILDRESLPGVPALSEDRVFVVPNGVDIGALAPPPRRDDLVARYGLSGAFTFGYVSNLDHPREGQELLVEAVRRLRQSGIHATAVIVGDGVRRAELEELTRRTGVEEAVVFTGAVPHEEIADYYALLDVFVVPRIDERAARLVTPLKPYEAMALQLPIVVSALPALLEIIGDGERGVSFPPGDVAALADALTELAGDPDRRASLASAGRRWVQSNRNWADLAARYTEVYALLGVDVQK